MATSEDVLRDIKNRITQQVTAQNRAQLQKEAGVAKATEARSKLQTEFGVSTTAEAAAKKAELEQQLQEAIQTAQEQLAEAGV